VGDFVEPDRPQMAIQYSPMLICILIILLSEGQGAWGSVVVKALRY